MSHIKKIIGLPLILSALTLCACSQTPYVAKQQSTENEEEKMYQLAENIHFQAIRYANTKENKDRAAILAMQGEYKVDFDFKETVILQAGYEHFPPKQAGAFETVVVVKDDPEHIILQHLLVVGDGHVVKHWRQDWFYEAKERFEFVADQTWKINPIPTEKQDGHWTQCVYEVSDAPRYCGTGKWNHKYGVSTWTSDRSWRPLPRREYTVRDDYNSLNVENRHTITAEGWTHEQDNTKVVRNGTKTEAILVREYGFNNYRRVDAYNFSPAYQYWQKTMAYWADIREFWGTRFQQDKQIILETEVDGMPIIEATFSEAKSIQEGKTRQTKEEIKETLDQWLGTEPT